MNISNTSLLAEFQNIQKIGSGLTSTVYKGINSQKQQICLKVIDNKFYSKPIGKLLIDNEIKILKQIKHKNLLQLRKHQQNQSQNIIITDFCEGGNLYQLTKKCKKFTQQQTIIIIQGIINGLSYLYDKKIIHRDLKPQNIFFKKGQPIVADFGFAVNIDNKSLNKVNAGSPLYMSPEALKNLQFSFQSDVFAIGVIIYQMLKGKTPWTALSQDQLLKNMLNSKPNIQLKNKKFQKLILRCLDPKKQNRAKFGQIESFFNEWKNQRFSKVEFLYDVKNIKKQKQASKDKKSNKNYKLNLNKKSDKQNILNQTVSHSKTQRLQSESYSRYRNRSIIVDSDSLKTKRNKSQKLDQDFKIILARLDPQQMKFLPSSMIQKFKFILNCYSKFIDSKQSINEKIVPNNLLNDKMALDIIKCKNQKDFCQSVSGYIGRMYRLAKNYKVYQDFIKDIQVLYIRVESFA